MKALRVKTAAERKPAPAAVENIVADRAGHGAAVPDDGYGFCPLVAARDYIVLLGFRYGGKLLASDPSRLIDSANPFRAVRGF